MQVIGHGIDLVEIEEIKRWIDDPRNPFTARCFSEKELLDVGNGPKKAERLAGRFAAKEAVMKALGTGFGDGVGFTDVEILTLPSGAPQVVLYGAAATTATHLGITEWRLSTSHTGVAAVASAIALGKQ